MGAIGVALVAGLAAAQPTALPIHEEWDPAAIAEYADEGNYDEPVDMASYFDGQDTYIYVAGLMTGLADGTVFTLMRYHEDDPEDDPKIAHFPSNHTTFTGVCVPVAMAVDPQNGEVYITGWTGTEPDRDYLTVKFKIDEFDDLVVDTSWGSSGAVTFDGPAEGDDYAADVVVYDEGCLTRVIVTGTSDSGDENGGDDIYTVAYYPFTDDGTPCSTRTGGGVVWSDAYNGPGNGNDKAVEMATFRIAEPGPAYSGAVVVVAGTVYGGDSTSFDLGAVAYISNDTGVPHWDASYHGAVAAGNEECTGIAYMPGPYGSGTPSVAVICGSTPHYPATSGDTDYVVWAVEAHNGADRWADEGDYGVGRTWTPNEESSGADVARDIIYRQEGLDQWVWVTGDVTIDGGKDVGTVAFVAVDGAGPNNEGEIRLPSVYDGGGNDLAVSIHYNTSYIYVTGSRYDAGAWMFTLEYDGDEVSRFDEYDGDAVGAGVRVIVPQDHADPFATGKAYHFGLYSWGWATIRYQTGQ